MKYSNPQENVAGTLDDGSATVCETTKTIGKRFVDVWLLNSAAIFHMTSQREWFQHYEPISIRSVYSGNNQALKIIGIRTMKLKLYDCTIWTIQEVKHVEDLKNLLSIGKPYDLCYKIKVENKIMKVIQGVFICIKGEKIASNLYMLKRETLQEKEASIATSSPNERCAMTWHKTLGHMSK